MKNDYDARERNLGVRPSSTTNIWRRRAIIGGSCVLGLVLLIVASMVWWSLTHVVAVRAVVCAAVVSLASDVDARMLELRVKPGERVTKGQLLARLDDSALRAALAGAEAERAIKESVYNQAKATAQLTESKVASEIALARAQVEIAKARMASAEASVQLRRAKLPEEIRRAKALRDEAEARLQNLMLGLRQEAIEAAKARKDTARARAELSALQVKLSEELVTRQVESPLALQVRKTELIAQQNELREAELRLAQLEAGPRSEEIEASKQALAAREAELAIAHTGEKELDVLMAELATRKAELQRAEADLDRAEAQQAEVILAAERMKVAAAELQKAEAEVARHKALIRGMSILSPVDGVVIRTFDHEGEVCRKGVATILVADESAGYWIEAFVTEEDARLVKVGQRATVELVLGSGDYVDATVEAVALSTSAVSRENPGSLHVSGGSESQLVWVKLRPLKPLEGRLPGMSASVVIRVR